MSDHPKSLWIAYAFTNEHGKLRQYSTEPKISKRAARNASIALIMRLATSERVVTYGVREYASKGRVA